MQAPLAMDKRSAFVLHVGEPHKVHVSCRELGLLIIDVYLVDKQS